MFRGKNPVIEGRLHFLEPAIFLCRNCASLLNKEIAGRTDSKTLLYIQYVL